MGSEQPSETPFDWVDCGPPYGDVIEAPDWDGPPERSNVTEPPETPDRYVSLDFGEDTSVIYDRTATSAWIQSTTAIQPADAEGATARELTLDTGERTPE